MFRKYFENRKIIKKLNDTTKGWLKNYFTCCKDYRDKHNIGLKEASDYIRDLINRKYKKITHAGVESRENYKILNDKDKQFLKKLEKYYNKYPDKRGGRR